ncbi:MAG: peptidase M6, partial [Prevotellaceae bacterium]|nr:peptidase M6 [Prevotellaceae bacterium]
MYNRIRLFSLVIVTITLAYLPMHSFAAKADPEPQTITQPDGTTITIVAHGDEFGYFITAADGALLVVENNALYVAKVTKDGGLTSTGVLAHNKNERSFYEQQLINSQDWNCFSDGFIKMRSKNAAMPKTEPVPTGYFPHNGSPKVLVVLAEFQDSTFHWNNTKEIFNSYLNAETLAPNLADGTLALNYSSVAEYFKEMSFGQFRPQFDVVGPVKLPNNLKTYGGGDDNVSKLVSDVLPLIADSVDFKQYDLDGNGYIDLIYFICASYSQSQNSTLTDLMWPKVTTVNYDTGKGVKTSRI